MDLPEFYEEVCRRSGYTQALEEKNDVESRGRDWRTSRSSSPAS